MLSLTPPLTSNLLQPLPRRHCSIFRARVRASCPVKTQHLTLPDSEDKTAIAHHAKVRGTVVHVPSIGTNTSTRRILTNVHRIASKLERCLNGSESKKSCWHSEARRIWWEQPLVLVGGGGGGGRSQSETFSLNCEATN